MKIYRSKRDKHLLQTMVSVAGVLNVQRNNSDYAVIRFLGCSLIVPPYIKWRSYSFGLGGANWARYDLNFAISFLINLSSY